MGDIQKLTDEILQDARAKAEKILADAQLRAKEMKLQAEHESMAHKSRIIQRAQVEAGLIRERIISGADLRVRDEKLAAKGKVIDNVMDLVRQKIQELPADEELKAILAKIQERGGLDAEETLKVRPGMAEKVKNSLKTAQVEEQEGVYGFVIERAGVMENHSFDTQLDFLKEDLEAEASQILFPN